MRLMIIIMLFSLIYLVSAKNNVKQLTDSMGQEVIEIGTPIKELPMGLEEEPSAEDESDDDEQARLKATGNTAVAAKKDVKKATTTSVKTAVKKVVKMEGLNPDDDEARIEKELSEIYKDTADYKSDSAEEKEVAKEMETPAPVKKATEDETSAEEMDSDKAIGRQRNHFRFQPDSTDRESIERFRTSVDEISCNNRQKLNGDTEPTPILDTSTASTKKNDAFRVISDGILLITAVLSYVFICS